MKQRSYQPKHVNKTQNRRHLSLTAIISYLLIAVVLTTGISFSRYTSTISGSDEVQVAKWDVKLTGTGKKVLDFDGANYAGEAETLSYDFQVVSNSAVAMSYTVVVTFGTEENPIALPAQVSLKLNEIDWQTAGEGKTAFTFGPYPYGVNAQANSHTLYIQVEYAKDDTVHTIETLSNIPVTITVTAEQED